MTNKKEINAAIIIIGNEVLSGRTKDINTSTLSLWLNSLGIEVKEVRIIPDVEKKIIEKYNVGFLLPYMESVGSDKKWFEEFCYELKKREHQTKNIEDAKKFLAFMSKISS